MAAVQVGRDLADVQEKIDGLDKNLRELEEKIEAVAAKADKEEDRSEVQRYAAREQSLRKEKEDVRKEKAVLLEFRLKLSQQLAEQAQASPAQTDVFGAFVQKLKEIDVDRPKPEVLTRVRYYYAQDLLIAASPSSPPDDALRIYRMAENMPGQTTRCKIVDELHISLNGPWLNREGWVLSGVHLDTGHLLAIKLLPSREEERRLAAKAEVAAIRALESAWETGIPIVPMKVVEVNVPKKDAATVNIGAGIRQAIQMPLYTSDLSGLPQLNEPLICVGTRRMITALEYLHGKGIYHMDVKADNVLVDGEGNWHLTDFGCATERGRPIANYTKAWYPENLIGEPSDVKHDWGMLVVLVAAVLDKENLEELKAGPEKGYVVTYQGLQQRLANIKRAELRDLVKGLCHRAGWETKLEL